MSLSIRPIEHRDLTGVSLLLVNTFSHQRLTVSEWEETLEWLYLSLDSELASPRGFVLTREATIVGHIGLTRSVFTDGATEIDVAHPVNWVVDRAQNTGLWAVRLMKEVNEAGAVTIVLGGTEDTQKVLPHRDFNRGRDIGRYIKVLRPWHFVASGHMQDNLARSAGKAGASILWRASSLGRPGSRGETDRAMSWHERDRLAEPLTGDDAPLASDTTRRVLRNTLSPDFLNWYWTCVREETSTCSTCPSTTSSWGGPR